MLYTKYMAIGIWYTANTTLAVAFNLPSTVYYCYTVILGGRIYYLV